MVVPPESFLNCVPGVRVTPGAPTHTRYRVGRASPYERRRHQIANPAKPDPIKRREEGPGTAAAAAAATLTSSKSQKEGSCRNPNCRGVDADVAVTGNVNRVYGKAGLSSSAKMMTPFHAASQWLTGVPESFCSQNARSYVPPTVVDRFWVINPRLPTGPNSAPKFPLWMSPSVSVDPVLPDWVQDEKVPVSKPQFATRFPTILSQILATAI